MSSSFTLAPGRLEAAGRSRGGQHAAQSRPPTPQRQSVLPGSPPDLQLSGVTLVRRVTQRSVPCKLQERKINIHTHPPQLQFYHWRNEPFMPVEFSAAAYRFGHSMIRPIYRLSTELTEPVGDEHPSIQGRKFVFSADRNKGLNG